MRPEDDAKSGLQNIVIYTCGRFGAILRSSITLEKLTPVSKLLTQILGLLRTKNIMYTTVSSKVLNTSGTKDKY